MNNLTGPEEPIQGMAEKAELRQEITPLRQRISRHNRVGLYLILTASIVFLLAATVVAGGFRSNPVTVAQNDVSKVAVVKSIPINYKEFGTGIPLLMLHGMLVDHHQMVADMEPLFKNRSGFRRIYPDLPGMGKTPGPASITSSDQMLDVMSEFMQTVAPHQRFVVAGYSYGGYLARGLVYKQGIMLDGVLLVAPLVEAEPAKVRLPPWKILVSDPKFVAALTLHEKNIFLPLAVVQSMENLAWLRANFQPGLDAADQNFINNLYASYAFSFPVSQLKIPFPGPTLILTGHQDSLVGYREAGALLDNYPRGTYVVFDRAGHFLSFEQQALFRSLTGEWLDRVEEYIAQTSSKGPG